MAKTSISVSVEMFDLFHKSKTIFESRSNNYKKLSNDEYLKVLITKKFLTTKGEKQK